MAKPGAEKRTPARRQDDRFVGAQRQTTSPTIAIINPKDGDIVHGNQVAPTGTATGVKNVAGVLARKDDPTKSVNGTPLIPPSPWSISFSKADVNKLFKTGETTLLVVLTVKDAAGVAKPQTSTFTIDRGSDNSPSNDRSTLRGVRAQSRSAPPKSPLTRRWRGRPFRAPSPHPARRPPDRSTPSLPAPGACP